MNYTHHTLPEEYKAVFLRQLKAEPEYIALENALKAEVRKKTTLSPLYQRLKKLESAYLQNVLRQFKTDEEVDNFYNQAFMEWEDVAKLLDAENAKKLDYAVHAALFTIDMLDSYMGTIGELLTKAQDDLEFHVFDKLMDLSKEARRLLASYHSDQSEEFEQLFADEADRIQDFVENKRMPIVVRKINKIHSKIQLNSSK